MHSCIALVVRWFPSWNTILCIPRYLLAFQDSQFMRLCFSAVWYVSRTCSAVEACRQLISRWLQVSHTWSLLTPAVELPSQALQYSAAEACEHVNMQSCQSCWRPSCSLNKSTSKCSSSQTCSNSRLVAGSRLRMCRCSSACFCCWSNTSCVIVSTCIPIAQQAKRPVPRSAQLQPATPCSCQSARP